MARPCSQFVHFDEVYRAPDRMYLSNRRPDKRICVSCGFLKRDHEVQLPMKEAKS